MKFLPIFFLTFILISCKNKSEQNNTSISAPNTKNQENPVTQEDATLVKKEAFKTIDISSIPKSIQGIIQNKSPKEIIALYHPVETDSEEGNESVLTAERDLGGGAVEVTLIHDNMMDDSVRGNKVVMKLEKQGNGWLITSIKENWRCWEGRGHTDWGIEFCN